MEATQRSDINDASARCFQMRVCRLRHQEGPARIGLKHGVPLRDADLLEDGGLEDAGVVYQDVELPEALYNCGNRVFHTLRVAHIAADREGLNAKGLQFGYGALRFCLGVAIRDGNICACLCQRECEDAADPFGSACDKDHAAL